MPMDVNRPSLPDDAAVQVAAALDRLTKLHPKLIDLSLDRTYRLLADLGDPHLRMPPVVHVAGTNGKGSTIANMRAVLEAAGWRVHVYTSPHLVQFAERIRIVGSLIDNALLVQLLEYVEQVNAGKPITFFEVTTAAAFLAFSRVPADVTLLETGLGGRLDSTNVIAKPLATVLTSISMDHMQFLGDTLDKIAGEKAAIMKPGVPCISVAQYPEAAAVIAAQAEKVGAPVKWQDRDWQIAVDGQGGFVFQGEREKWKGPLSPLLGHHQLTNTGAALAALEQLPFSIPPFALRSGMRAVEWPARMQKLKRGPLISALPNGWDLWLDGGHNADAGQVLSKWIAENWADRPLHIIAGMLTTKAAEDFLAPLASYAASLTAVPVPSSDAAYKPGDLAAAALRAGFKTTATAETALGAVNALKQNPGPARILICGSLYLAGEILKDNG